MPDVEIVRRSHLETNEVERSPTTYSKGSEEWKGAVKKYQNVYHIECVDKL